MKPSLKQGFSIIELIFVIAVLGIIAAVAVPKLLDTRNSALEATIKQDISTITTSIQSYYMLNNKIENISDAVTINTKTWDVKELSAKFSNDGKVCVSIEVISNKLEIVINKDNDGLCKKLYDSGVNSVTYEL